MGEDNMGEYKHGRGQTWESTNMGTDKYGTYTHRTGQAGQTSERTNVGPGQMWDNPQDRD